MGYAQNLISVELNNMVKQRQSQRALAGQVLEDVIHGTLEPSEATRRLAGIGVNSTRRNVVLLAESAAHFKQLGTSSLPQPLEKSVERRRRQGPGGGGPRRRQRRQRAGPEPQRPPGRGRDPRHDRDRRSVHQAQRAALELLRGPRCGQPRPARERTGAAEPDVAAAGQRGRAAGGHGERIAQPAPEPSMRPTAPN